MAIRPDGAKRLTNLLSAAVASCGGSDSPLCMETICNEVRAHLKIILVGGTRTLAQTLEMISGVLDQNV